MMRKLKKSVSDHDDSQKRDEEQFNDRSKLHWFAATTNTFCAEPKIVEGPISMKSIAHVSCGMYHMACVTGMVLCPAQFFSLLSI